MPGWIELTNADRSEGHATLADMTGGVVAKVMWWEKDGPFYSFAVHPSDPANIYRIGPITGFDRAKQHCEEVVAGAGPADLKQRAGYPRS